MDDSANLQALISVDELYVDAVDRDWLESVALAALEVGAAPRDAEVSILITDDETVQALNFEYRGLDETTDVLSFSAEHAGHWEGEGDAPTPAQLDGFVLPPGVPEPLGEIIVSWPQAQRQAAERGANPLHELALLLTHGALHLLGHDHVEPDETTRMQALEREALSGLQLPIGQSP